MPQNKRGGGVATGQRVCDKHGVIANPPFLPQDALGDLVAAPKTRRRLVVRVFAGLAGFVLVALGFIGVVLPIVPGWPLFVVALPFLAMASETLRRLINRLDRRLPMWIRLLLRKTYRSKPKPKDGDNPQPANNPPKP